MNKGLLTKLAQSSAAHGLAWEQVSAELIRQAIDYVVADGGGVTFGRTRDGKSLTLRLFIDGESENYYCPDFSEAEGILEKIIVLYQEDIALHPEETEDDTKTLLEKRAAKGKVQKSSKGKGK